MILSQRDNRKARLRGLSDRQPIVPRLPPDCDKVGPWNVNAPLAHASDSYFYTKSFTPRSRDEPESRHDPLVKMSYFLLKIMRSWTLGPPEIFGQPHLDAGQAMRLRPALDYQ